MKPVRHPAAEDCSNPAVSPAREASAPLERPGRIYDPSEQQRGAPPLSSPARRVPNGTERDTKKAAGRHDRRRNGGDGHTDRPVPCSPFPVPSSPPRPPGRAAVFVNSLHSTHSST